MRRDTQYPAARRRCSLEGDRAWRRMAQRSGRYDRPTRAPGMEEEQWLSSPLAENAMYRFKTLAGPCLWARRIDSQAIEVAIRVGVLNRMTELARPQSIRIA